MTKLQTSYKLSRALTDEDLGNISRVHAVYGIFAAKLQAETDDLFIEYDATRLSKKDVRATLERHGIPVI